MHLKFKKRTKFKDLSIRQEMDTTYKLNLINFALVVSISQLSVIGLSSALILGQLIPSALLGGMTLVSLYLVRMEYKGLLSRVSVFHDILQEVSEIKSKKTEKTKDKGYKAAELNEL